MSLIHEAGELAYRKRIFPQLTGGEAEVDREIAQRRFITLDQRIAGTPILPNVVESLTAVEDARLAVSHSGLLFPNPIGVAAGLDKDAKVWALRRTGFGLFESGSITKRAYTGNPPVRVFVLEEDESAINRMGFPGEGTEEAAKRLRRLPLRRTRNYVAGINISASVPSFETGTEIEDIVAAFVDLKDTNFDYCTGNVSSPNTKDLVAFTNPDKLRKLLVALNQERGLPQFRKPMFVKFGPDLERSQKQELTAVVREEGAQGFVLTNTSTSPNIRTNLTGRHKGEAGGISGQAIRELSKDNVKEFRELWSDALIIGVGGVNGAQAAWEMIAAGADVTQSYTALFMRKTSSPFFAYRANRGLVAALNETGIPSISSLRGTETPWPFS